MFKYKFLSILDSLSDKEFKMLNKFINSSYFNESKLMIEFYGLIKIYYYNHNLNLLTPESISEKIFKTKKYDSVKTRKLISDFNSLVENFLIHNSLGKDDTGKKVYLTNQLKKRGLDKYFRGEIDDLKRLSDNPHRDGISYYFTKVKLADEELLLKKNEVYQDKKIKEIKNFSGSLENLYIYLKLYINHILVQNSYTGENKITEYGLKDIGIEMKEIEYNIGFYESAEPRIYLLYITLKHIMTGGIENVYYEIENYIEKNRTLLNSRDIEFSIYTYLNYVVNEISMGRNNKAEDAVKVLKRIDEKGLLNNLNDFNYFTFLQIINFALQIKDTGYAEVFLWRYFPKLKINKEDSMNLAIASLRFAQGRYSEAKDHIKKINFRTYGFYLFANSILLKIFYEENSFNFIPPLVDSYKHYLKRNKYIPVYFKESYGLFLAYLTRLSGFKKKKRKDILKFEYEISHESNFYGKEWIEEKIKELVVSE